MILQIQPREDSVFVLCGPGVGLDAKGWEPGGAPGQSRWVSRTEMQKGVCLFVYLCLSEKDRNV